MSGCRGPERNRTAYNFLAKEIRYLSSQARGGKTRLFYYTTACLYYQAILIWFTVAPARVELACLAADPFKGSVYTYSTKGPCYLITYPRSDSN